MIKLLIKELFYTLTGALLAFFLMEIIWPGVVLAHINYNFILLLWLINGIVILLTNQLDDERKNI